MRIKGSASFIMAAVMLIQLPAFAQKSTAAFMYYRPGAVSSAMGGIGVSNFENAYSEYFNPAGLAFSPTITAAGSFDHPLPLFLGDAYSFVGASFNVKDLFAVGVSTNLYWKGNEAMTNSSGPLVLGLDAPFDWQGKISVAYRASPHIGVGASVSLLETTIADYGPLEVSGNGKSSAILFDIGIMASSLLPEGTLTIPGLSFGSPLWAWTAVPSQRGISIGASLLNFGGKIKYIDPSRSDYPPTTLLVGASYYPLQSDIAGLMLGIDAEKRLYDGGGLSYLHYGSELTVFRVLALRAGYFQGTASGESSFFTFGAGIRTRFFSLNFARYVQAILPTWQFDGTFSMEI